MPIFTLSKNDNITSGKTVKIAGYSNNNIMPIFTLSRNYNITPGNTEWIPGHRNTVYSVSGHLLRLEDSWPLAIAGEVPILYLLWSNIRGSRIIEKVVLHLVLKSRYAVSRDN